MTVGSRVKQLRENKKMTQQEFAESIGVSLSSVQKWELDIREICQEQLIKISELFNVSTDYLLGLKYDDVDVCFYGQLGELTEDQKKDVIRYAQFIRSKNALSS